MNRSVSRAFPPLSSRCSVVGAGAAGGAPEASKGEEGEEGEEGGAPLGRVLEFDAAAEEDSFDAAAPCPVVAPAVVSLLCELGMKDTNGAASSLETFSWPKLGASFRMPAEIAKMSGIRGRLRAPFSTNAGRPRSTGGDTPVGKQRFIAALRSVISDSRPYKSKDIISRQFTCQKFRDVPITVRIPKTAPAYTGLWYR